MLLSTTSSFQKTLFRSLKMSFNQSTSSHKGTESDSGEEEWLKLVPLQRYKHETKTLWNTILCSLILINSFKTLSILNLLHFPHFFLKFYLQDWMHKYKITLSEKLSLIVNRSRPSWWLSSVEQGWHSDSNWWQFKELKLSMVALFNSRNSLNTSTTILIFKNQLAWT